MPIYEYRCRNGHNFEVIQSMMDDPVAICAECGAPVERVFHPVAVHFKGSGFYTTDYARKGDAQGASDDAAAKKKDTDSKKPDSKKPDSKKPDSKSSKTATSTTSDKN
jgi:putative FmdB family regulatory protein